MSQRMVESVSQRDFYGNQGMYYMASQAATGNTDEDLFHNAHLQLQEHIRNPIAFHAEMMGDIMYLQQVLKQPYAKEFVQAVIKEIQNLGLNIEDQGHPADYVGVNIKKLKDGSYEFTQ
jgi:hypothetical protein